MANALRALMGPVPTRVRVDSKARRGVIRFGPHRGDIKLPARERLVVWDAEHTRACGVDADRVSLRRVER